MAHDSLSEFLRSTSAQLMMWGAVVAVLCAIAWYVVGKMRDKVHESGPTPSDFMTNFRELHARGELSDEEFRTIKAKLASSLQEQLKSPEERA